MARSSAATDKATASFIRRTLCAHQLHVGGLTGSVKEPAIEDLLPPLTSSNEVDLQLYAFIAIIIKEFVQPWYSKITPDHVFMDEVIQIVAHCTRALEQRVRKIDLDTLILEELPAILDAHVIAYRTAHDAAETSVGSPNARIIYNTLRPHPALFPIPDEQDISNTLEREQNDSTYRRLIAQGILAVLLPTEDLQNPCLRALVGDVLGDFVLGDIIGDRMSDSTFLWDSVRHAAEALHQQTGLQRWAAISVEGPRYQLERYGLLVKDNPSRLHGSQRKSISDGFWQVVQFLIAGLTAARILFLALASALILPRRTRTGTAAKHNNPLARQSVGGTLEAEDSSNASLKPIITAQLWPTIERLVFFSERMPWLSGVVSLLQHLAVGGALMGVGDTNGRVDRLLAHALHTRVLAPAHLPLALRSLRANLFPNNALPPSSFSTFAAPDPGATDVAQDAQQQSQGLSRRGAALATLNLVPRHLAKVFFGTANTEAMVDAIGREVLEVFSDPYMNRHLVYGVMETILARVLPELTERGVSELLAERGVVDSEIMGTSVL